MRHPKTKLGLLLKGLQQGVCWSAAQGDCLGYDPHPQQAQQRTPWNQNYK